MCFQVRKTGIFSEKEENQIFWLKISALTSILCVFSADSVYNPRRAGRSLCVLVRRNRVVSQFELLRLHHDEPRLCWTIRTARQSQGSNVVLSSEMLEIRRARFECKLMNCSIVLNYFGLGLTA